VNQPSPPLDTLDGYCLAEEVIHALACGGLEESQRSRALAHLDDCELCQALLAEEVRALPQTPSADDAGLPTLMQLEALVAGRYRIKRFVARGGMGEVYAAWDMLLSERVALKTINPVAAPADQIKASARFRQEVQLSRRVADPHVCRIYEFGQHLVRGFGTLSYLTMEFIEGQTLGARIRQGPRLGIDEVMQLSRQMLRGLAAAHAVGVLHRDFKSDNVMLRAKSASPDALHAVIMDFGLARLLGDQALRLTERHELVGSASYMAPEQVEENAPLSEATDIYAFGVVLFEMLTGRLPFEGTSAVAVALRRLSHPAPPPSTHVPELSPEWDALVLGCLERDVSRRFSSTNEVDAALQAIAKRRSIAAPVSPPHRRGRALAVACGVALIAGVAYLSSSRGSGGSKPAPTALDTQSVTHTLSVRAPAEPLLLPEASSPSTHESSASPAPVASAELDPVPPPPAPPPSPAAVRASSGSPPATARKARTEPTRGSASPAVKTSAERSSPEASPAKAAGTAPPLADHATDVREVFFLEPPSDRRPQNSER
jgi:serine/threonine protein kinase